jgi:hypothetical protein
MTKYGAAQLTNSKYYGTAGMESLRAMLEHADRYGLKWVFVRDPFYEPLLAFAGWRRVDSLNWNTVGVWTRDGVPPAKPIATNVRPTPWEGLMWGTLPVGASLLAILMLVLLPERKRRDEVIEFPASAPESVYLRGVK